MFEDELHSGPRRVPGIALWDLRAGKLIRRIDLPKPSTIRTSIGMIPLSPDGQLFAFQRDRSAGFDRSSILLMNIATGEEAAHYDLEPPGNSMRCVAFSPDGHFIASGGQGGVVFVWDRVSGQMMRPLRVNRALLVRTMAFSPDNRRLLIGGHELGKSRSVALWDVETGKEVKRLEDLHASATRSTVYDVWFAAEGERVIISSMGDRQTRIPDIYFWDTARNRVDLTLEVTGGAKGEVCLVAVSPDAGLGVIVGTGGEENKYLYDLRRGTPLREFTPYRIVAHSTDRQLVLMASSADTWELWKCGP